MRREILFRAKRSGDEKWIEGYLDNENYINTGQYERLINPDTICQYTGLTDKNGNKIWENDIVRGKMHGTYGYRMYTGGGC